MNWAISLGSIAGIRVRVHFTFVLFLLWIGTAFWQAGGPNRAAAGIAYILLLFACVVAHEFGHILVASRYGGVTEDVILLPIGGVARMRHIPEAPREELAVALAGPAVNIVIAAVLIALIGPHALASGLGVPGHGIGILPGLAVANLVLAVFNLLPAFPMDGGRALRALLSIRMGRAGATDLATRIGHSLAVGMGISGFLIGYPMLMLVALFIWFGASAENSEAQLHSFARRLSVADAMITRFATLPAHATIAEAVSLLIHSTQHDIPILDGPILDGPILDGPILDGPILDGPILDGVGKPLGLLTRDRILTALHERGGACPVADVLRTDIPRVSEGSELDDALRLMEDQGLPAVLAVDRAGRLTGLVTVENLGQMLLLNRLGR